MAIKVIEEKDLHKRKTNCNNCGSLLEFEHPQDLTLFITPAGYNNYHYIECPICNNHVKLYI